MELQTGAFVMSASDPIREHTSQFMLIQAAFAQVNKLMQAQKEQLADERAIILAEHKKELQTLVSVMSASVNRDLPNRIEGIVTREVRLHF